MDTLQQEFLLQRAPIITLLKQVVSTDRNTTPKDLFNWSASILQVKNISFNYPGQSEFKGIKNISFDLESGQTLSILGKSGCGKTTLLKCIFGLEDVNKGSVLFLNEKVYGPSRNLIPGHPQMKLVSQDYYVLDYHTIEENIADKLVGYTNEYKKERVEELLHILDLKKVKSKKARELSSGQKQRVSIARALAEFPSLLLLDEPFSHLDNSLRDGVFTYIRKHLVLEGSSCILVTHQPDEALRYSNTVMIMDEGKILRKDTPERIYHQPLDLKSGRLFGKCFELEKQDFESLKGIKLTDKKILVRPEDINLAKKGSAIHLKGKVENILFALDKYEVLVRLKSGKAISFYCSSKIVAGAKEIALGISFNY
jgi:iron(III) transport system ATP-binding protein